MEQVIYLIIGAALTWAFYFIQRRVERRRTVDAIDRHQRLLMLKQGLETAATSLDELRRFENRLIGRAESAARIADTYFSKAEEVARHTAEDDIGQAGMNRDAIASFRRADGELDTLVRYMRRQLDGKGLATFEDAHATWLDYRDRYARFIAETYSGGAIRPLIHAVTLENVTLAWMSELEMQMGDDDDEEESDDELE
jgi:uncharacterized protein YecT (DUF1311 family)